MSEDLEAPDESRLIRIAKNGVRVRGKNKIINLSPLQSGGIGQLEEGLRFSKNSRTLLILLFGWLCFLVASLSWNQKNQNLKPKLK